MPLLDSSRKVARYPSVKDFANKFRLELYAYKILIQIFFCSMSSEKKPNRGPHDLLRLKKAQIDWKISPVASPLAQRGHCALFDSSDCAEQRRHRACLAGLRLLQKRLRLLWWERLLWWSWSRFLKCLAKQLHLLDCDCKMSKLPFFIFSF